MMRILIVSSRGKLTHSRGLAEALAGLGVEANCVCDMDFYALSEFKVLKHVPFPRLMGLIGRFRPDFTLTDVPYYTAYMAKLMGQPLLVFLHGDMWTEARWARELYPFLPKRVPFEWMSLIMARGIEKADLVLPISCWLEKQIKQHLPNHPTHVLYTGVKAEEWRPEQGATFPGLRRPAAVGVFDLGIYPKVAGLLRFMRCARKMPSVQFYFAGDGPYMSLVRQSCPPNIFLLGRLSRPDVEKLLASGDLFVHPSRLDALPTAVMEASLMEKPIVASSVGGIPEIVKDGETGYLCDLDDIDQWIERISFLLDNPSVGRRLGKKARKYVIEKFDWMKIAEDFINTVARGMD